MHARVPTQCFRPVPLKSRLCGRCSFPCADMSAHVALSYEHFAPWLVPNSYGPWSGVAGKKPTADDFTDGLQNHDIFVYVPCAHPPFPCSCRSCAAPSQMATLTSDQICMLLIVNDPNPPFLPAYASIHARYCGHGAGEKYLGGDAVCGALHY